MRLSTEAPGSKKSVEKEAASELARRLLQTTDATGKMRKRNKLRTSRRKIPSSRKVWLGVKFEKWSLEEVPADVLRRQSLSAG